MRHLYSSKVRVLHLETVIQYGAGTSAYVPRTEILDPYAEPGEMWCRLDLNFIRPGKDIIMPNEKGVIVDRFGVLFCDYTPYLERGNRIVCIDGPIEGTFEINAKPDIAQGYNSIHHIEVAIREVAQAAIGHYEPASEQP